MDAYGSANAELLGDLVVELAEVTATLSARLAERDVEAAALRAEADALRAEAGALRGEVTTLRAEVARLLADAEVKGDEVRRLGDQLHYLRTKVFGSTSERGAGADDLKAEAERRNDPLGDDDDEAAGIGTAPELAAGESNAEGEPRSAAAAPQGPPAGGKRKGKRSRGSSKSRARAAMRRGGRKSQKLTLGANVPRKVVDHPVPADLDLLCALCDTHAKGRGVADIAREIDTLPSQVIEVIHRLHEARCLCGALRFQMPGPVRGVEKTIFSPAFVARVITDKFVSHIPCYRQAKRLGSEGVTIDYRRLNGMVVLAWLALAPLVNRIRELNRLESKQSVDESPIRVVIDGVKEVRYLWCLVTNLAVSFVATAERTKETARQVIGGATPGSLTSDRLSIYRDLFEGKADSGCLAHCRRYFWYALPTADTEALAVIEKIKELYAVEDEAKVLGLGAADRLALRQAKSVPLMNELKALIESFNPPPRSALGRANKYALKHWKALLYFTTDGSVEIDNNHVEAELRDPKLGQKNYLFSQSEDGTDALAGHYTLVRTAAMYGHDPRAYYADVLAKLNGGWPAARLDELLPWNWRPPDAAPAAEPVITAHNHLGADIREIPRVRARVARMRAEAADAPAARRNRSSK
jgi:transposase